jgi:putative transposase
MKSRAVLGYHISDNPNSQTIAMAIRHMLLPKKWDDPNGFPMHGLPVEIFVDNGKDYWCHQLTGERRHLGKVALDEKTGGLLPHLGINQRHAIPYNARSKMVERWHGTLELFVQNLPGYCGHDTKQRPESLKADLKAHEAWQKVHDLERPARFGTVRAIEEEKMIAGFDGESPFLNDREFLDVFEGWLTNEYHQRVSEARGIVGRTPLNVWTQEVGRVRELAGGIRMLDILLQKREQRVVQQSGVAMFGIGGQRRWYEADILWSGGMVGQTVEVLYDPNDISEIYLYFEGKFLCTATTRKLLSMKIERDITTTESDVRQAIREQRRQMREFEKSIKFAREAAEVPDALERYVKKNRDLEVIPAMPEDFPMAVNQSISVMPNDAVAREAYRATAPGAARGGSPAGELPLRVVHRREEEDLGVSNFEDLMD